MTTWSNKSFAGITRETLLIDSVMIWQERMRSDAEHVCLRSTIRGARHIFVLRGQVPLCNRHDYSSRFRGMLDRFMGSCDLSQRNYLGDVESLPVCLKRRIDVATRLDLCFRWHVVAAHEEEPGVHKNKLPDWSLRYWYISSISRNGTTLCQQLLYPS